jgi:hypothetical protein
VFDPRRPRAPHAATVAVRRPAFTTVARPPPYAHSSASRVLQRASLQHAPASVTLTVGASGEVTSVVDDLGRSLQFAREGTSAAAAVREGGVVVAPKSGGKWRVMFLRGGTQWELVASVTVTKGASAPSSLSSSSSSSSSGLVAAPSASSSSLFSGLSAAAAPVARQPTIEVANGILRERPCRPLKFSSFANQSSSKGHLEKHGAEVNAKRMADYLRAAREFGDLSGPDGEDLREAWIDNTSIRVGSELEASVPVLIVNNHQPRTFYVWDPAISSDPFAFAIFYTLTANRRMSIHDLSERNLAILEDQAVDLFAMERELIDRRLAEGRTIDQVAGETLAPRALVAERRRNRGVHRMNAELERARRDDGPTLVLSAADRLALAALTAPPPAPAHDVDVDAETLALARELGIDV